MRTVPLALLGVSLFVVAVALSPAVFAATGNSTSTASGSGVSDSGLKFLAAGIAFGLAAAGAGIGLAQSGAAAIAAVVEKPEVRTSALIFVALAEAIAIYGFVMAIIILGQTG